VLRSQIPDANLRKETKRGFGVKGKDYIFGKKKRKKEEEGTIGIRGEGREREERHIVFNFIYLFNLINLIY